jgi:hypothetical protein
MVLREFGNILDFGLLYVFVLRAGRSGWTQSREVAKTRKGKVREGRG